MIKHIQDVIHDIATPSWLRSVPHNFGLLAVGTLKADKWLMMTTIYLPVALVSLWGKGTVRPSPQVASFARKVPDHTMALVSAISLACMHTMTKSWTNAYPKYILSWMVDLTDMHPKAKHSVNGHMAICICDFFIFLVQYVQACNCNTKLLQRLHVCDFVGFYGYRNLPRLIGD